MKAEVVKSMSKTEIEVNISGLWGKGDHFTSFTPNHTASEGETTHLQPATLSMSLRCADKTDQTGAVPASHKYLIKTRLSLMLRDYQFLSTAVGRPFFLQAHNFIFKK